MQGQASTVVYDILDFSSSLHAVCALPRGTKVFYLRGDGLTHLIALSILSLLNHPAEKIASAFGPGMDADNFTTHNSRLLEILFSYLEPSFRRNISNSGCFPNRETQNRVARFLTLRAWPKLRLNLEVVELASLAIDSYPLTIFVERHDTLFSLVQYYQNKNVVIRPYAAPLRWRYPRRSNFWFDAHDRPSSVFALSNTLRSLKMICAHGFALLTTRCRNDHKIESFDVLALTGRQYPNEILNDVYWAESLRKQQPTKILLLHLTKPSKLARDYYNSKVDHILSINELDRQATRLHAWYRSALKQYLLGTFKLWRDIIKTRRRAKLSVWTTCHCFNFMERVAFFQAFFKATGARVCWSNTEGHELNTQAMAAAALEHDAVSASFSLSLRYDPAPGGAINRCDVFLSWGQRQKEILINARALVSRYVVVGYPLTRHNWCFGENLNTRPAWLRNSTAWSDSSKVVCFFDNTFSDDGFYSKHEATRLYEEILGYTESQPNLILVLKSKKAAYKRLGPAISMRIEALIHSGRVIIREQHGDLEAGLAADVVIGVSASSLASLSASHGIPCVLFDARAILERWPIELDNIIVFSRPNELAESVAHALTLPRKLTLGHGSAVDYFSDLDSDIRSARYLGFLIDVLRQGNSRKIAIEVAEIKYAESCTPDLLLPSVNQ